MRLYNLLKIKYHLTKKELSDFTKLHNIRINNESAKLSSIINDNDKVFIDDILIDKPSFVYYLYNKPKGITSVISNKDDSYIKHINVKERVFPAGRLDKDSNGLLFLSNDPEMLNLITKDKSLYDKEYIVTTSKIITDDFIINMQKPHILDNKMTTPAKVYKIDNYNFTIILYEGMYHQIRRMVKMNNNKVIELKRIRIGKYKLDNIELGCVKQIEK